MGNLPVCSGGGIGQLSGNKGFFQAERVIQLSVAGDKVLGAFQDYPHFFDGLKGKGACFARLYDANRRLIANAWYTHQCAVICGSYLNRKLLQMLYCPVALRVNL